LSFVEVDRVHFLWAALVFAGILWALESDRRAQLARFLSPLMQTRLAAQATTGRAMTQLVLVFLAMAFAIGAVMQPISNEAVETMRTSRRAADVIFALDVSRSMLADDVAPTRFVRAKSEIEELVDRLEGHRVGLIAFAGRAAQVCPLTPDHSFFRTVLSTIDTRSAGKGGTKIGAAIKTAVESFPAGQGAKLIVLITDGDDQDSYSEEAAKAARDAGVQIVAVGLGTEEGSPIRLVDPKTGAKTVLEHEGKPVISKLNGEQLRKIALVTEGAYIPAGTSAIDLDSIMANTVQPLMRDMEATSKQIVPREHYPWFVLLAIACMLAALWVGAGVRRDA
jgi:Ca-activated chloride channel family protein